MNSIEEKARSLKSQGNNCSISVYGAFLEKLKLSGNIPEPRSIDGKCGAVLAAAQILKETGKESLIPKFEEEFISKFGYIKCADLMSHEARCNDYVGESARLVDEYLND